MQLHPGCVISGVGSLIFAFLLRLIAWPRHLRFVRRNHALSLGPRGATCWWGVIGNLGDHSQVKRVLVEIGCLHKFFHIISHTHIYNIYICKLTYIYIHCVCITCIALSSLRKALLNPVSLRGEHERGLVDSLCLDVVWSFERSWW